LLQLSFRLCCRLAAGVGAPSTPDHSAAASPALSEGVTFFQTRNGGSNSGGGSVQRSNSGGRPTAHRLEPSSALSAEGSCSSDKHGSDDDEEAEPKGGYDFVGGDRNKDEHGHDD